MFVFFPHDGHLPFLFVNIYTNINALSCKNFITLIAHKLKFCLEIFLPNIRISAYAFSNIPPRSPIAIGAGYACQPTRKRYFSVPHRSYVGTIDPVKKIDGIIFVIFDIDHFTRHIQPRYPYPGGHGGQAWPVWTGQSKTSWVYK